MMAKLESKVEEISIPRSRLVPPTPPEYLCSHCLRPHHESAEVEYCCETCGAAHYVNEFYICCDVDAERPL
jgi:hypothetical protein